MSTNIIGQLKEIKILQKALQTSEAELIAITGRLRIGKPF
jgi:AAA+ ATPase superfamily predicted ATPase